MSDRLNVFEMIEKGEGFKIKVEKTEDRLKLKKAFEAAGIEFSITKWHQDEERNFVSFIDVVQVGHSILSFVLCSLPEAFFPDEDKGETIEDLQCPECGEKKLEMRHAMQDSCFYAQCDNTEKPCDYETECKESEEDVLMQIKKDQQETIETAVEELPSDPDFYVSEAKSDREDDLEQEVRGLKLQLDAQNDKLIEKDEEIKRLDTQMLNSASFADDFTKNLQQKIETLSDQNVKMAEDLGKCEEKLVAANRYVDVQERRVQDTDAINLDLVQKAREIKESSTRLMQMHLEIMSEVLKSLDLD